MNCEISTNTTSGEDSTKKIDKFASFDEGSMGMFGIELDDLFTTAMPFNDATRWARSSRETIKLKSEVKGELN